MGDLLQPTHLVIIAILLFVLFGARRLPELGKGLGEGLRGFREGIKGVTDPPPSNPPAQPTQQSSAAPQATSAANPPASAPEEKK